MNPSFKRHRQALAALVGSILLSGLAAAAETVVKWPALTKLDVIGERCEALSKKKDIEALRKIAPEAKAAADKVAKDAVPAGAKDAERVKSLQADLKSLVEAMGAEPQKADAEELAALLEGIHPVVEQLMEASGVPHVHEHEHDHDHDEKKPEKKDASPVP